MLFRTSLFATLLSVFAFAASASSLTYNWSFTADFGTSLGEVTGTISGLHVGSNDGTGLTIEVLSSPSRNVLGGGWTFDSTALPAGDAFFVESDLTVSFADALFFRDGFNDKLFFGGYGGWVPQLFSSNESDGAEDFSSHSTSTGKTIFAPIPLPAGLPLLLTGLAGFAGLRLRKKRAAKV